MFAIRLEKGIGLTIVDLIDVHGKKKKKVLYEKSEKKCFIMIFLFE
jgi:hypothetical protein